MQSGKFQYELQEFSNPTWKHCQTNHLFHLDQACFVTHACMTHACMTQTKSTLNCLSVRLPVFFIILETKVADPAFKLLTMAVGYNSTVCQEQVDCESIVGVFHNGCYNEELDLFLNCLWREQPSG